MNEPIRPEIHYQIPGFYTQDQWFFRCGPHVYFYHLLAPLSAGDSGRWGREVVGVSRSQDLVSWEYLGVALGPSDDPEAFDSRNIATGTTLEWNGRFYMFYCAGSLNADNPGGIGLAASDDLVNWRRVSREPVLRPDRRWYAHSPNADEHYCWADPFVFWHEADRCFHMLITGRMREGSIDERGCVALARSSDLLNWEMQLPLVSPGLFDRMEVPSLWACGGRWYLMFCAHGGIQSPRFRREYPSVPDAAAYVYTADDLRGPYELRGRWWVLPASGCYTARVITETEGIPEFDGRHALMTWQSESEEGRGIVRTGATRPWMVEYLDEGGFVLDRRL